MSAQTNLGAPNRLSIGPRTSLLHLMAYDEGTSRAAYEPSRQTLTM
jgi:hypothetical protein